MPTTFNGSYIQEPADLQVVCTEADIISVCDDPGGEDMRNILTFAGLNAQQKPEVVAVMNSMIGPVESLINSYARKQGYAIPLAPIDALIKDLAARLLWIDMRQHAKSLTADAAEKQRADFRTGTLKDLGEGRLRLTAARDTSKPPQSATVYSLTDAASRDVERLVPRMSRKALEGF